MMTNATSRSAIWLVVVVTVSLIVMPAAGLFVLRQLALWLIVGDAEEHIPPYNPDAKPSLPPHSRLYSIWPDGIPAMPIDAQPHFIDHPGGQPEFDEARLIEAGCTIRFPGNEEPRVECDADSPLAWFGCVSMRTYQHDIGSGLDPAHPFIATCDLSPGDGEGLYRASPVGSAHHVFQVDGSYVLASSPADMQELFAPIDSPEEALAYAQLLTGLSALYEFKPRLGRQLFLQEVIEDSRATDLGHGYFVHLFHRQGVGCGPFVTSEVGVIVDRDGTVTWMDATPVYLDLHSWCID